MTQQQKAYIEYLILDFTDYLNRIANHRYSTIDGRYFIQDKALASLKSDFYADKASLTSRQALQIISALNAYSPKKRVEQILRLTFLENVKRLKDHLVTVGINPSNLSSARHRITPETLAGVQTADPVDQVSS